MTAAQDAQALIVTRDLPATPDKLFDWLTDPAKLALWMAPVGKVVAEADVRPGGRLMIVMVDGQTRIEHRGEYLEVIRPRRLAFTWNSPYTEGDSLVTIDLAPRGEGTQLILRHERLPASTRDAHAGGWGQILDRLGAELEKEAA